MQNKAIVATLLVLLGVVATLLPHRLYERTSPSYKQAPVTPIALQVPVLMYHHVGYLPENSDSIRRDLTVSPEDFSKQVAWLSQQGYTAVSLESVYQALKGRLTLPKHPVVFTFDDGYSDVVTYALPVLEKYGFRGSLAIVPGLLGKNGYTTWEQLSKAVDSGHEVVSHTNTHIDSVNFKKYTETQVLDDYIQANQAFKAHLGFTPHILVYPFGHENLRVQEIARKAGYDMALTTAFGVEYSSEVLQALPRVRVHGAGTLQRFTDLLDGRMDTAKANSPKHILNKIE